MIPLRALPFRWLLPVLVVVDLWAMYSRGPEWRGSWMWTADWAAGCLILYGPLAAGVAAMVASWQRKVFAESVGAAIDKPRWVVAGFGSTLGWLLAVHAIVLIQAFALTASVNPRPDPHALVVAAAQFAVLAGFIGAGWGAGQFLSTPVAGMVAAVGAFVIQIYHWWLPDALFDFGGSTGDVSDFRVESAALVASVLFGVGALIAGSTLPPRGRPPRTRRLVTGGLGAALVLAAVAPAQAVGENRFWEPELTVDCESTDGVQICLSDHLEYARGRVTAAVGDVVAVERRLGVRALPLKVVQSGFLGRLPRGIAGEPGLRRVSFEPAELIDADELRRNLSLDLIRDWVVCDDDRLPGVAFDLELAVAGRLQSELGVAAAASGSDGLASGGYALGLGERLSVEQARDTLDAFGSCDRPALRELAKRIPLGR